MTLRQNNAEGYASGTAIGTGQPNSGSPWDVLTTPVGSAVGAYDASTFMHGTSSYHFAGPTASNYIIRWTGANDATQASRFYLKLNALPSAAIDIFTLYGTTNAIVAGIGIGSGGQLLVKNAAGATVKTFAALTVGTWYRVELQVNVGTGTTDGTINAQYYMGDSGTVVEPSYVGSGVNAGGVNVSYTRLGKQLQTPTLDMNMDDIAINNGTSTPIGPSSAPPNAAFTSTVTGLVAAFSGAGSTDASGNPVSAYDWDFGDGTAHGSGVSPSHTYAAGGTFTVTLTVTDSNGATDPVTNTVAVSTPQSNVVPTGFTGTGWTPSSGTAQAAIADADPTTYILTPTGGGSCSIAMPAILTPATGTDVTFTIEADRINASSGTLAANLYEGSTLRASAAPQNLAAAAAGSPLANTLTFVFPAASVANVTNWNTGISVHLTDSVNT